MLRVSGAEPPGYSLAPCATVAVVWNAESPFAALPDPDPEPVVRHAAYAVPPVTKAAAAKSAQTDAARRGRHRGMVIPALRR
jgi:hypothetical protein